MAARKLRTYVHVMGEDGFTSVAFGPDDSVPDWAAAQIGDHCFEDEEPAKKQPARKTADK